jgi:hypothetical protein
MKSLLSIMGLAFCAATAFGQFNVALQSNGGIASQSSLWTGGAEADKANDGNRSGLWNDGSVQHTTNGPNEWWQVVLNADYLISSVNVWNRTDGGSGITGRINPFRVTVFDGANIVWEAQNNTFVENIFDNGNTATAGMEFLVPNVIGDRVRIMHEQQNYLHMGEVEVMATAVPEPATLLALGIGSIAFLRRRQRQ